MLHSTARRTQRPKDIFISSNQHSLYKENIPPKGILKKSKYMAPLGEEEQEEDL